jgi:membrane protease YdiL (CAAX protease family)
MDFDLARPAPRWGMPDILIGLVLFLIGSVVFAIAAAVVYLTVAGNIDLANDPTAKGVINIVGLAGSWVGMVGWLFYCSRRKGQRSFRRDFGFRMRWFDPLVGFGVGIATLIVANLVATIVTAPFHTEAATNSDSLFGGQTNTAVVIITALMAAIGAPIVEELFFRGLTLRAIEKRFGWITGVIGSAALFGILHWTTSDTTDAAATLGLVAAIAVYGLSFALIDRALKRLGPSIFAHMTINGIAAAYLLYTYFGS